MTLAAGSKLGPYEILGAIGAGGMGEVYRAKDPRLGREVAIKVLPASFSQDADRLRRFEQEAKAAGILNHPNITAVYDIGTHDGAPYVVQELLEGETLRSVLAGGRLAQRKCIDHALQIAHGLAAAHEKGIVHRDLKPENLFVTKDGRVKILDFGLAKLTHTEEGSQVTNLPTATAGTEPGVVLGTLGYMAPEQVRGKPADARSDIFSFGAILYEMLSGKRAFQGDSAADTMSAILKEDPPDLSVTNQNVSPGLERIVRHCLEKNPEQRFHSAHDLAFDLEALSTASGAPSAAGGVRRARGPLVRVPLLAAAAVAFGVLLGHLLWREPKPAAPSYRRLTFRRGNVLFARFTADGQTVVYGAAWGDRPAEIFLARVGSPESRPLGIPNASLLSVSSTGELAILMKKANLYGTFGAGTLARVPLTGGTPRQILDDVLAADWSPDGKDLAVLREVAGGRVLEYPLGRKLLNAGPDVEQPRVSPDGGTIALIDHLENGIVLVDRSGKRRVLVHGWLTVDSSAWVPSGREVWFYGVTHDGVGGIWAVDLSGHTRLLARTPDLEAVHDISRDGRALVEREISVREVYFGSADEKAERNLSWLEQSSLAGLSNDGKMLLFDETAQGGGQAGSVYLRATDGSPPVRLGDGAANDLSSDGKWVLTMAYTREGRPLVLLPTAAGDPRPVPLEGLLAEGGFFLPDGKRLVVGAREPGHGVRGYVVDVAGGKPRAFTPEGLTGGAVASADGSRVASNGPEGQPMIFPIDGGEPRPIPGLERDDIPIGWSPDGDTLYVTRQGEIPKPIYRYSFAKAKKTLWKEIVPADRTGLVRIENLAVTPDGRHYAYSINRVTASDLYVVTGWK